MLVMSVSLLYAATWLTATTLALVARHPSLQARADTAPEYPNGYNAKTCPLERTSITLHAVPAISEAVTLPGAVRTAPTSSLTQRAVNPDDLSQICRQVAHYPFTGADYYRPPPFSGRILTLTSSTVQPGLYVGSIKADRSVRSLEIDDMPYVEWQTGNVARVEDNVSHRIGVQWRILTEVRLKVTIRFWAEDTTGEFAIFKIGPSGYTGLALRMKDED